MKAQDGVLRGGVRLDDLPRAVVAASVDHDDPVNGERGRAGQRPRETRFLVQGGDDDRDGHRRDYGELGELLNMKKTTRATVPQNTSCLCQKRTSP